MKYIIEIENNPFGRNDDPVIPHGMDELYRAKGFKSLVFDKNGLDKLIPYTEPDRKAIEDEVWKLADNIHGMSIQDKMSCFGFSLTSAVTSNLSCQEAKAKYESWLKQKDEIHVGDEVTFEMAFGNGLDNNMKAVALDQATKGEEWCVLTENGCIETHDEEDLYKTGRHFDEVEELLKKMRGEQDD